MNSNFKFQISNSRRGFTLIEILVVIVIIAVVSAIVLFSVMQYINKGKDANIQGNLAVLVPAGEVFYNGNMPNSYKGFCDSGNNSVLKNSISQMPPNSNPNCPDNPAGICCSVNANGDMWAACARGFSNNGQNAFCVDSRGVKTEISNNLCQKSAPIYKCE